MADPLCLLPAFMLVLLARAPVAAGLRRDVLELGDEDFDYLAMEHETMLVAFFAPWCGHCKKIMPELEKAATRLKGSVQLAKVDCTAHTHTCGRFGVTGFPTLKIFRYGRDSAPYDGPRTAAGIFQHMRRQTGPDSLLLTTSNDLKDFINNYEASIVGVFPGEDSPALAEFLKAAALLREQFRFAHTTNRETVQEHTAESQCVLLFRPPRLSSRFEDSVVVFKDYLTIGSLRRFIRDHLYGLCPHMTLENRDRLRARDLLTAYCDLDYHHNVPRSNYWRNRVMKVVSRFSGRGLTFSVASKKEFMSELEDFGWTSDGGERPLISIRTRLGHKYSMREEFTNDGESLVRFLEDYFAGRLKRFIKSEPIPERETGAVRVVVAESFEEVVNDPERDVLVLFHSPSCPRCKKLEPIFRELAALMSSDPKITIAKMNAVDNDVPAGYNVKGFPTIYFAPVGKKNEPIKYEGGRGLQDLLQFVKREAGHTLTHSSRDEL